MRALLEALAADTTSRLCADINDWTRPISAETLVLADLFDLTVAAHTDRRRRVKPHPIRPWTERTTERKGSAGKRTRAEMAALLAAARAGRLKQR